MMAYLVYDSDYRLFELFENRPTYSYEFGWDAEGWHDVVSESKIPEPTKLALAEKGILRVCAIPEVLFHTNESVHIDKKEE